MNKRNKIKKGFTLIELLVVIAIIGILAGLMFPAISGAIENANATKLGNQGKNIATAIITENMQREASNSVDVWPKEGEIDKEFNSPSFSSSSKSNEYFEWLISKEVVEGLTGYGPFAGGGIGMPPSGSTLNDGVYNVWNIVANLDQSSFGDPPFIFTRNLKVTASDLTGSDASWRDDSHWNADNKPFGRSRAVIVSRGSAVNIIRARDMTRRRFIGDAIFNNATNKNVQIWEARE